MHCAASASDCLRQGGSHLSFLSYLTTCLELSICDKWTRMCLGVCRRHKRIHWKGKWLYSHLSIIKITRMIQTLHSMSSNSSNLWPNIFRSEHFSPLSSLTHWLNLPLPLACPAKQSLPDFSVTINSAIKLILLAEYIRSSNNSA